MPSAVWFVLNSTDQQRPSCRSTRIVEVPDNPPVFVLAWAAQFIGHSIEGKKPAFTEDLQFLLVSPAWLLDALSLSENISK